MSTASRHRTSFAGDGADAARRPRRRALAISALTALTWVLAWTLVSTLAATSLGAQTDPLAFDRKRDPLAPSRRSMVEDQVRRRGITAPNVLSAMEEVPRHLFVPEAERERAYEGNPVTIAPGQNLSQAYLSARMIELLDIGPRDRVLEIGTGSGYDAALLSRLAREVHTIEINPVRARQAEKTLRALGYVNVHVHVGDGYLGLPTEAPFDAILLTTAPREIPEPLLEQLEFGGRMVVAVGDVVQELQVITKTRDGREVRRLLPVKLGEMTGEAQNDR